MDELQLPLFPTASTWVPPLRLPDLSDAKIISLDTENHDPGLKARGPGFIRREGKVAGISVATDTGFKGYFPIGHLGGGNLDRGIVAAWLADTCRKADRDYVFHSAQYDLGWLRSLGVEVAGRIVDVAVCATLLDEEHPAGYSLDALAKRTLGRGKDETLLRQAASDWDLDDAKGDLWKLPSGVVGPYAEEDAVLALQLWTAYRGLLKSQDLEKIADLEFRLTPILHDMHWQGIRVDLGYAERLDHRWRQDEEHLLKVLGFSSADIWRNEAATRLCDRLGIAYPKTDKGNPSVTKDFLEQNGHESLMLLRKLRALNRTRETFLYETLIKGNLNGRIHPQYIQMASEDGGTRTGRLACRNPNAQQFPKRSTLFDAKALRKALLPEEGMLWAKFDYWSQEPTIQCHYGLLARLPGAEKVRDGFKARKKLYTMIEEATNGRCNYDQAKAVVLGRSYGMGAKKMASTLGMPEEQCAEILRAFDQAVGYISLLASAVSAKAQKTGFVRTIGGRKRHFDHWAPVRSYETPAHGYEEACARWPGEPLERVWCHKAFNALVQGSAADQTKTALVQITGALGLPQMTVHDEISKSVKDEKEADMMRDIMENCVPMLCPVQTDLDLGKSWC